MQRVANDAKEVTKLTPGIKFDESDDSNFTFKFEHVQLSVVFDAKGQPTLSSLQHASDNEDIGELEETTTIESIVTKLQKMCKDYSIQKCLFAGCGHAITNDHIATFGGDFCEEHTCKCESMEFCGRCFESFCPGCGSCYCNTCTRHS
jgi:hypothetical protein